MLYICSSKYTHAASPFCSMNQSSMEVALSAISGEILSRLISFIIKKHTERSCLEEKLERLHHLLLRVHTVVEEAEGRYITNSKMLVQLRMLVDGMYKGYHVLNTFRLKPFEEGPLQEQVTPSSALSASLKRTRAASSIMRTTMSFDHELQASLENLETAVANMTEFVILLSGCKQMHKRPYDTYIYIDNFMFSRVVEKQELINALLQDNFPIGAPAVIPVIGAYRIGKKSLVGYACNDDTVRSHFSSVLHLKSNSFMKIGGETFTPVRTLVVVEFISDVDDSKWVKFYSATLHMGAGSKVVILSRFQEVARFGTVKPILLRSLSQSEFSYLFKVLAFAGTDPKNHPQLESIAMELAENINGLLLVGNMLADLLRTNQNVQFWFHILKRFRNSLERNFSKFGCPTLEIDGGGAQHKDGDSSHLSG
ncbi:putative disease resistance RPP13-like protein 1 isoform X2 [Setaria viridis]|uniref:putative disease resistance RPP13-like protein 1 isoform X2 n=1 Tax=Setaria viridis TaxID=4556 RepID=UPI003B3BAE0D